jgi:hypothetical protein
VGHFSDIIRADTVGVLWDTLGVLWDTLGVLWDTLGDTKRAISDRSHTSHSCVLMYASTVAISVSILFSQPNNADSCRGVLIDVVSFV